jgi:beta-glucosidase
MCVQMPITIYDPNEPMQSLGDYNMTDGLGRTYRYYTGKTLYAFGFGLPFWGEFPEYSNMQLSSQSIVPCGSVTVTVTVTAPGNGVVGDEVVQCYVAAPPAPDNAYPVPIHAMQGFSRVTLGPSAPTTTVSFSLDAWSMSVTNADGDRVVNPGKYVIWVGSGQPTDANVPAPLAMTFVVTGSSTVVVASGCPDLPRRCYAC